jgi:hypothetical protein
MESFESEVITIINWKRSSLLRHFTQPTICLKRIFSGLTPLEMENSFNIGKNDPEEEVKPV